MSMLPFRVFTLGFSWVFVSAWDWCGISSVGGGSGGVRVLFGWVVVSCAGCRFGRVFWVVWYDLWVLFASADAVAWVPIGLLGFSI